MSGTSTEHRETFAVLDGAQVDYGGRYEYLMTSYTALKLIRNPKINGFKISNNSIDFGKFDDLVVETESTDDGSKETWAAQLKHSKTGKHITAKELGADGKNDFNIKKYFNDYQERSHSENTKLLLFTNRQLADGKLFEFDKEPYIVAVKKSTDTCGVDTSANSSVYQLEIELKPGQAELEAGRVEKYKKFFASLYIYANQKNVEEIDREISRQFNQIFKSDKYDRYVKFFENWCRAETPNGLKQKMYKEDVGRELGRILLEPHIKPVIPRTGSSKEIALKALISKFDVTVIEESCDNFSNICDDILVVPVNEANINSVYQAIKLLYDNNKKQKLILVGDCVESNELKGVRVFKSLADCDSHCDEYKNVVETFSCVMQGRKETCLGAIFNDDDKLKSLFKIGLLLQMVNDKCVIGDDTVELPKPYINRSIIKKKFRYKLIGNLANEILIISCSDRSKLAEIVSESKFFKTTVIDITNCDFVIKSEKFPLILVSTDIYSTSEFNKICSKLDVNQSVFHFEMIENHLYILNTHGSLSELRRLDWYTDIDSIQGEDILMKCRNKTNVLVADPGMGKTVCADSIKRACPFDVWPIKINLRDKLNLFRDKIEEMLAKILNSHETSNSFRNYYNTNKEILLIWDGLDEVGSENVDLVLEKIRELSSHGYVQWITSRSYLREKLESSLNVLATTLTEVTSEDQKNYIYGRLLETYGDEVRTVVDVYGSILKSNRKKFKNTKDMFATPLLLHMFTIICRDRDKFKQITERGITLTQIYSMFIDAKFDLFNSKILNGESNALASNNQAELKAYHMSKYQKAAFRICFDDNSLMKLRANNCDQFLQKVVEQSDDIGIMTKVAGNKPIFVHQTLAEYCAAVYLAKKHRKFGSITMRTLFRPEYENIRFFFDMCLSEGHPAHQAVLELNLDKLEKLDKDVIFLKDKGGRNPLHLASSYGTRRLPLEEKKSLTNCCKTFVSSVPFVSLERDDSDYKNIVDYLIGVAIEKRQAVNYKDEIYEMNCVEYADISLSLYAIEAIVKIPKVGRVFQNFVRNYKDTESLVTYSIVLDYKNLFSALDNIPYFEINEHYGSFRERLKRYNRGYNVIILTIQYEQSYMLARALENRITKKMINNNSFDEENPLSLAVTKHNLDIFKLLIQHGADAMKHIPSFNKSILDFVIEQGNIDFVKYIVEEELVQIDSKIFNSLMMMACKFGHFDIYNYCITKGTDFNQKNCTEQNLLHLACRQGNIKIIQDLVQNRNVPLECVDSSNNTPLLSAASQGQFEISNYLIGNGANITAQNTLGHNVLHYACEYKRLDFIRSLPQEKRNELDSDGKYNETLLLTAASNGHFNVVNDLLANGANIYAKNRNGKNLLHYACYYGLLEFIQSLPNAKLSDLDSNDHIQRTPLLTAAWDGHFNIVNYLLKYGAKITAKDRNGRNVLHYACDHERLDFIQNLPNEKLSELDNEDNNQDTPLLTATSRGHFDIANYLLENGANINAKNYYGKNVLHHACEKAVLEFIQTLPQDRIRDLDKKDINEVTPLLLAMSKSHFDIVNYLLENGANILAKDRHGKNVLHHACEKAILEFIQSLPEDRIRDLDSEDENKATPLLTAASNGHFDIVNYLLDNRATIFAKNRYEENVLHYACENGLVEFIHSLPKEKLNQLDSKDINGKTPLLTAASNRHGDIVTYLLKNGANIIAKDRFERNVLHYACETGDLEFIQSLPKEKLSNFDSENAFGKTPLLTAASKGHFKIVNYLLEKGANITVKDSYDDNVLHYACKNGCLKFIQSLPKEKLNELDRRNKFSKQTPLVTAASEGHFDIVNYLLEKGADITAKDCNGKNVLHYACKFIDPDNSDCLRFFRNLTRENVVALDGCPDECSWEPTSSQIVDNLRNGLGKW